MKTRMHSHSSLIPLALMMVGSSVAFRNDHLGFDPNFNRHSAPEDETVMFKRVAPSPKFTR